MASTALLANDGAADAEQQLPPPIFKRPKNCYFTWTYWGCAAFFVTRIVAWWKEPQDFQSKQVEVILLVFFVFLAPLMIRALQLFARSQEVLCLEKEYADELKKKTCLIRVNVVAVGSATGLTVALWIFALTLLMQVICFPRTRPELLMASAPAWLQRWFKINFLAIVLPAILILVEALFIIHALLTASFAKFAPFIETSSDVVEWDQLAAHLEKVNIDGVRLLYMGEGGLVIVTVGAIFVCCAVLGAYLLLALPMTNPLFWPAVFMFFVGVVSMNCPLCLLAHVTSLIMNSATTSKSVLATARRYPCRNVDSSDTGGAASDFPRSKKLDAAGGRYSGRMSTEEDAGHDRFMRYLAAAPIGAEMFGVQITTSLVASIMRTMILQLPTVLTLFKVILRNHRA